MFTPSTSKIRFVFILYSPSFLLLLNLRWFYIFLLPWLIANWFYFSSKPPPYFNSSCFFVTLVCILEERNNIGAMESLSHSLILFESVDKLLWGVEGSFSLLRFEEKFDFQFSGRWPAVCHWLSLDHFSSDLSRFTSSSSHLVSNNDERQHTVKTKLKSHYPVSKSLCV